MKFDRRQFGSAIAASAVIALTPSLVSAQGADAENTVWLDTKDGRVVIRLRPDLAPKHVAQIKALVKEGFYDGIVFHRVIEGFMAQTGDPTGTGTGGSKLPNIPAEFTPTPFRRGTLGMARSQSPNSANSQFFICFAEASFLNNQYTVFGEVTSGMDVVDKIKKGSQAQNGQVQNPDKILRMRMADAK
jgi:peptidylprolyl isomerase